MDERKVKIGHRLILWESEETRDRLVDEIIMVDEKVEI